MKTLFYENDEITEESELSIFLAGPTPRDTQMPSWRPDALKVLESMNFEGSVIIPEYEVGMKQDWDAYHALDKISDHIGWEMERLEPATVVMFWVPRNLENMPAFTTNIEWGKYYDSGKVVLGFPDEAPGMNYFIYCAYHHKIPSCGTLDATVCSAIILAKKIMRNKLQM